MASFRVRAGLMHKAASSVMHSVLCSTVAGPFRTTVQLIALPAAERSISATSAKALEMHSMPAERIDLQQLQMPVQAAAAPIADETCSNSGSSGRKKGHPGRRTVHTFMLRRLVTHVSLQEATACTTDSEQPHSLSHVDRHVAHA